MNEQSLCDVWRVRNPDKKAYTWYKRMHNDTSNASRIDFFLVNSGVANKVSKTNITSNVRTDHSMITIEIIDNELKRGPGVWKFNDSLLKNDKFLGCMTEQINDILKGCERADLNPIDKWEHIKIRCRKFTQKYTKNKSNNNKRLALNLNILRDKLLEDSTEINNQDLLTQITLKIRDLEMERTRGAIHALIVNGHIQEKRCQNTSLP